MKFKIDKGEIKINITELIRNLSEEDKKEILRVFVFDEIIPAIEMQLKHKTDAWSYSANGDNDGAKLREHILKIQGLEPEFKEDLETKIRSLQSDVANYKKYYDWYFKLYHFKEYNNFSNLFSKVVNAIGDINK